MESHDSIQQMEHVHQICRICMNDESEQMLYHPCLCTAPVHLDCTKTWLLRRNELQTSIPGNMVIAFRTFRCLLTKKHPIFSSYLHCEVCLGEYEHAFIEEMVNQDFAEMRGSASEQQPHSQISRWCCACWMPTSLVSVPAGSDMAPVAPSPEPLLRHHQSILMWRILNICLFWFLILVMILGGHVLLILAYQSEESRYQRYHHHNHHYHHQHNHRRQSYDSEHHENLRRVLVFQLCADLIALGLFLLTISASRALALFQTSNRNSSGARAGLETDLETSQSLASSPWMVRYVDRLTGLHLWQQGSFPLDSSHPTEASPNPPESSLETSYDLWSTFVASIRDLPLRLCARFPYWSNHVLIILLLITQISVVYQSIRLVG